MRDRTVWIPTVTGNEKTEGKTAKHYSKERAGIDLHSKVKNMTFIPYVT